MYCILSLVHPYMELLKKTFAPKYEDEESYDTYLNLIYRQQGKSSNKEEYDSST
ncbi:2630_t:CDS:1, partial [Cetraspora pellucida]